MARSVRKVRTFDVAYDDADGLLHINSTTRTEITTGRGTEHQQGDREYEKDVLVISPDEFAGLVRRGFEALAYQAETVRRSGIRVDYRSEEVLIPADRNKWLTQQPAPQDDDPSPCGRNHTIAEHNYDPDKEDADGDD